MKKLSYCGLPILGSTGYFDPSASVSKKLAVNTTGSGNLASLKCSTRQVALILKIYEWRSGNGKIMDHLGMLNCQMVTTFANRTGIACSFRSPFTFLWF